MLHAAIQAQIIKLKYFKKRKPRSFAESNTPPFFFEYYDIFPAGC